jgi:hypothetical protein
MLPSCIAPRIPPVSATLGLGGLVLYGLPRKHMVSLTGCKQTKPVGRLAEHQVYAGGVYKRWSLPTLTPFFFFGHINRYEPHLLHLHSRRACPALHTYIQPARSLRFPCTSNTG